MPLPQSQVQKIVMSLPEPGDIVIRGTTGNGFELLEPITLKHLAGPFASFAVAVVAARAHGAKSVWQLSVDHRGRALGEPFRLPSFSAT
jgi:hypothetical protein